MSSILSKAGASFSAKNSRMSDSTRFFVYLRDYDFGASFADMRKRAQEHLRRVRRADLDDSKA